MFEELMSGAVITVFAILLGVPVFLIAKRALAEILSRIGLDHLKMSSK